MLVTARDVDKYHPNIVNATVNPIFQYVEVGGGLGQFIMYIAGGLTRESPTPILIDHADYELMRSLLIYARGSLDSAKTNSVFNPQMRAEIDKRLDTLIRRAESILDGDRIKLVNLSGYSFFIFVGVQHIV